MDPPGHFQSWDYHILGARDSCFLLPLWLLHLLKTATVRPHAEFKTRSDFVFFHFLLYRDHVSCLGILYCSTFFVSLPMSKEPKYLTLKISNNYNFKLKCLNSFNLPSFPPPPKLSAFSNLLDFGVPVADKHLCHLFHDIIKSIPGVHVQSTLNSAAVGPDIFLILPRQTNTQKQSNFGSGEDLPPCAVQPFHWAQHTPHHARAHPVQIHVVHCNFFQTTQSLLTAAVPKHPLGLLSSCWKWRMFDTYKSVVKKASIFM